MLQVCLHFKKSKPTAVNFKMYPYLPILHTVMTPLSHPMIPQLKWIQKHPPQYLKLLLAQPLLLKVQTLVMPKEFGVELQGWTIGAP